MRLSKKKLKDVAWRNISEMFEECSPEDLEDNFGFFISSCIDDAYKIGYANAKKKFAILGVNEK